MHNLSTVYERIDKVLIDNGFVKPNGKPNYSRAERECGIKGTVLSKTVKRKGTLHDSNKEKFLRKFHVNHEWFDTGKGEPYLSKQAENHTSVRKSTDGDGSGGIAALSMDSQEVIKTLLELEKVGDYRFVPKQILDDYDLVPKTSRERDKTIEALERVIAAQDREIDDLRSGRLVVVTPP